MLPLAHIIEVRPKFNYLALNPQSSMGSVISKHSLDRMVSMVEKRKSGNLLIGGQRMTGLSPLDGHDLSEGYFYSPTVISEISTEDELWQEEIFGPVIVVKRFKVFVIQGRHFFSPIYHIILYAG